MIPIPERMRHLNVYRGYAVPWGVLVADGVVHFAINREEIRDRMISEDRCSICGTKLLRGRWFVGGPGSAFHPRGAYIDMPMHSECKDYSLTACPYLAAPHYGKEIGPTKAQQINGPLVLVDATTIPDRPSLFVAVFATGQRMTAGSPFQRHVVPKRPFLKTEFWRHGARLDPVTAEPEARLLAAQIEAQ